MRIPPLVFAALLAAPTALALDPAITTQTLLVRIQGTTGDPNDVTVDLPSASAAACSWSRAADLDFLVTLDVAVSCTLRTRDCTPVQVTARHPVDEFPGLVTSTLVEGDCGGDAWCLAEEGQTCTDAGPLVVTAATRTYRCNASAQWVAQTDFPAPWQATCSLRVV